MKQGGASKFGRLAGFNRDHLSKSIIIHHTKNSNLINTASRYNYGDNIDEQKEEDQEDALENNDYGYAIVKHQDHGFEIDYIQPTASAENKGAINFTIGS